MLCCVASPAYTAIGAMSAGNGAALVAAAVQAACIAKAPRRTVAAVAAALAATVLRPVAVTAAPSIPRHAESEGAPGSVHTAGDDKIQKLREARRAKRILKRQRRREGAKAAATSDAPMEGPADIEFAGDMVVEMERFPSTFAEAARMKGRVGRLIPATGDVDMFDYSKGRRTLTDQLADL